MTPRSISCLRSSDTNSSKRPLRATTCIMYSLFLVSSELALYPNSFQLDDEATASHRSRSSWKAGLKSSSTQSPPWHTHASTASLFDHQMEGLTSSYMSHKSAASVFLMPWTTISGCRNCMSAATMYRPKSECFTAARMMSISPCSSSVQYSKHSDSISTACNMICLLPRMDKDENCSVSCMISNCRCLERCSMTSASTSSCGRRSVASRTNSSSTLSWQSALRARS
mmetsp:Transcript_3013/g.8495  ORF Transcript_3013/g.8495 Transcript_3013/m.8495 type:complete len:227 (-) Transcript_3013:265-945(-)